MAVALLLLPYPDLSARLLACLLLVMPIGEVGLYFLHCRILLSLARIVLQATRVTLQIPNYLEGWLFAGVTLQLCWEEICCVQHTRQSVFTGGKMLDEYWIHSTSGNFVLTPSICTNPANVAQLIMTYKQCEVLEIAPAQTVLLTPLQKEQRLKQTTRLTITLLVAAMLALFSFVLAETQWLHSVLKIGTKVQHAFTVFFFVATVAGIVTRWLRARSERGELK